MKKLLFTYIIIQFSFQLFAQFTIDGAQLKIESNAMISINQNCVNNGEVYNDGSIYLTASWKNNNIYESGIGNFILNGTTSQNIYHNSDFYNLTISGGGDKFFLSNSKVLNKLDLSDGKINIGLEDTLKLSQNAVTINSSDLSFVNGKIYCEGTGYKLFPIGKDNTFAPVELVNVNDVNSLTGFEVFFPNIITDFENDINEVSDNRYWEIENVKKTEINSQIILSNDYFFEDYQYPNLIVVEADEANQIYHNIGNFSPDTTDFSTIKSLNIISGKYFAIALLGEINSTLFIPSALSPYASNENDRTIKIYGDSFIDESFSFQIYNKWGNLIFSTTSLQEMKESGWNGINQKTGNQEVTGMYSYILKAKYQNGKDFQKSGTIMIIR